MRILGAVDGVGSMMIGARGKHEIIGNIEWRKYYHTGTFEANFPGSFMVNKWDDLDEDQLELCKDVDLVIGHPECGNFSILNTKGYKKADSLDIPYYTDIVNRVKPKFYVADNLPKSLWSFSLMDWHNAIPGYKVVPLWVSNHGYGNIQKHRNRLFLLGIRDDQDFEFVPNEVAHDLTMEDIFMDLPEHDIPEINHVYKKDDSFMTGFSKYYFTGDIENDRVPMTYKDFRENIILDKNTIATYNLSGQLKKRPGFMIRDMDKIACTLSGGGFAGADNIYMTPDFQPLTLRQRARIQGAPDDFIFHPLNYPEDKRAYNAVMKQSGKFMPVQFCTYIVDQIGEYIDNGIQIDPRLGRTILKPNPIIEEQKEICAELL